MLEEYLPTVLEYSLDNAEVIIADNASTDDSLQWLGDNYPKVRTIVLNQNFGFAEGYNKALAQIDSEYYILLNSDVKVTPHWLVPLTEYMDSHQEVAACQPKLLSVVNNNSFGRIFESIEQDEGQYDTPKEVLWATGACLMIRSKDYWKVGGLDARYFAHNEEIDLCWRLRLYDRKIICLPDSKVYHLGGGTLPKGNPRKTYLNFRNNLLMLYKCLPDGELCHVMRARKVLDYVAAFQTLVFNANVGDFKAIFRARRDFHKMKPLFKADREKLQSERLVARVPERYDFSILWKYYIKRIHRYSELFS